MARTKKIRLKVLGEGAQRYISVPVGRANDLHAYLRNNRVISSPPEPAFTGFDSIQLPKGVDVPSVQQLLNAWE